MKQHAAVLFLVIVAIITCNNSFYAQQSENADKIWSVKIDPNKTKEVLPDFNWTPAKQVPQIYDFLDAITVSPNFRLKPTTNSTQSEMSVDVHPLNHNIIFGSANATDYPVTGVYGTGVYWSLNGGSTWTGFDNPPFGSNRGDPASVIGTDGRFYENYISASSGQGVSVSTNNGGTWTSYTVAPNPGELADKNHYMVDKKVGSPYENRSYCVWSDFGGAYNNQVVLSFSSNFGVNWTASVNLSGSLNPLSHAQGANVQTGPNGEVYVTYAIYDAWPGGEDAIGFSKSTNGGVTWTHARVYSAVNFGIRGNLSGKANIRVSSFPSMAVDRTGGTYNGTIYITWPQKGVSPAGTDPDIVLIKSTNGGTTWSTPVRVNNDPINNGKDQYYPWCTVDQSTGQLMLVFYDSRNVVNSQAEVYMARSLDRGVTFENFKVSDQAHTPAPISGLASGYAGDYIGVASLNNVAYPLWSDNRTGLYQGWMAKVSYGPPCPVNPATNPAPANAATNVSALLSQLTWTNGSGATQCEVWFGVQGNMSLVYSGGLISSWSVPAPLNYNTVYNWKVISKNDTCGSTAEDWAFTTEASPGVVFQENFTNLNCWTAMGPLGLTNWSTQNSANAGGTLPELRLNWSPEFNGLSKLRSCPVSVLGNRNYSVEFKHMLDWFGSPTPTIGLGISYDNGVTYTTVWSVTATGNVGPATVNASFTTPPGTTSLTFVIYCNGNSYNIDYWYVDNLTLIDDDFLLLTNPSNVTASAINTTQINIGFTPNASSNNVVIVWNQTGTFTTPSGAPPAVGQPLAGGTLLYNGTTSPVQHTGLNSGTSYYYKAFSYSNLVYSTGVQVNAATIAIPANPTAVAATPVSSSQINISYTPNASNNNVVIVWNLSGTFTTPSGSPPGAGQPFAGGTLLYNGTASPVQHTGLNSGTSYYYKAFSYSNLVYSTGVQVNAATIAIPANPTAVAATPVSSSQINISYTPNGSNNNVVVVWNLSGTFTTPSGTPPGAGQPFAGGTLLYNGTASPVQHTGLNPQTNYYYKLFSYANLLYSAGVQTNTTTLGNPAFQLTVNVINGWNVLSIPGLHPVNQNVATWWSGKDPSASVFEFQGGYYAATTAEPGKGYWLKHIGNNTYNTGDEWPAGGILFVPHNSIAAAAGWNLIGGYEQIIPAGAITTTPAGLISGSIFKYEGGYSAAAAIEPGYGYFIKLTGAGQINIPSGSAGPYTNIGGEPEIDYSRIIITDNADKSFSLYAAPGDVDLNEYELPPIPPPGSFDVRFSSQRYVEKLDNNLKAIDMMGIQHPLNIKADGIGIIITDETGKELARLSAGEEITLSSSFNRLYVKENIIPSVYSLEQNYPNPFNPATTIQFSIPEDVQNARLNIYDALGEKVAELVNSGLQAGYYNYRWEAGNLSSGTYIYQLITEKFISTKKMILLK